EHLLIGMIEEPENLAVTILKNLGIDLAKPREIFESRIPAGQKKVKQAQLTTPAQSALRLAQEQAVGLGHGYVGCETLLLGLLMEPTGMGGEILRELGLTADAVRAEIVRLVQSRS